MPGGDQGARRRTSQRSGRASEEHSHAVLLADCTGRIEWPADWHRTRSAAANLSPPSRKPETAGGAGRSAQPSIESRQRKLKRLGGSYGPGIVAGDVTAQLPHTLSSPWGCAYHSGRARQKFSQVVGIAQTWPSTNASVRRKEEPCPCFPTRRPSPRLGGLCAMAEAQPAAAGDQTQHPGHVWR